MTKYLFRGKRTDNDEWMYGAPVAVGEYVEMYYFNFEEYEMEHHLVAPETIGQYTGMKEFVVTDRSYHKPLFEGDIVEVWSTRRPYYTNPKSKYDGDIKVRAVIRFTRGEWTLDYDNNYNKALTKLRGREEDEHGGKVGLQAGPAAPDTPEHHRVQPADQVALGDRGAHLDGDLPAGAPGVSSLRDKRHDIVKLGNIFDNADLLEANTTK